MLCGLLAIVGVGQTSVFLVPRAALVCAMCAVNTFFTLIRYFE